MEDKVNERRTGMLGETSENESDVGEDERELIGRWIIIIWGRASKSESRDLSVLLFVLFKMTRLTALMKESPTRR